MEPLFSLFLAMGMVVGGGPVPALASNPDLASADGGPPVWNSLDALACRMEPEPPAYYAFPMVSTRRVPGTGPATGTGHVSFPSSPFGIAIAADGSYELDVSLEFERLRPAPDGAYVVWFTTPTLDQVKRVGVLDPELRFQGHVDWNKFLVVVTLEPNPEEAKDTWAGPIVLRGMSRSGLMHTMAGHGPFEKENCAAFGY
jgi:hypothetical protein